MAFPPQDPFFSALFAGLIGGIIVAAANSILRRSDEHSHWIRGERQRLYSEVTGAAEALYHTQDQLTTLYHAAGESVPARFDRERLLAALQEQTRSFERLNLQVKLLASPRMRGKADDLIGRGSELAWAMETFDPSEITWPAFPSYELQWEEIEDFVSAARGELGAGRDPRSALLRPVRRLRYRWTEWRRARSSTQPDVSTADRGTSTHTE
jgi:hypothetical protein